MGANSSDRSNLGAVKHSNKELLHPAHSKLAPCSMHNMHDMHNIYNMRKILMYTKYAKCFYRAESVDTGSALQEYF